MQVFYKHIYSHIINSLCNIYGIFEAVEQVMVWVSLRLRNREEVYEKSRLTQNRLCKYNLFNNFKYSL